jgi:xanthine dehydrogenase accessory factor
MNILELASEMVRNNAPCVMCTVVRTSGSVPRHAGAKMLVGANGAIASGTVGGGAMESRVVEQAMLSLAEGQARLVKYQLANPAEGDPGVCGGEVEIFIEPLLASQTLLIFGAGHVGRALVHLAKWSGFHVVVVDDRQDLCNETACPGADQYLPLSAREAVGQVAISANTYIALVTRSYPLDVEVLPLLIKSPARYIGVIGSQRRWLTAVKALRDIGMNGDDIARVHAPIGIEIGAETPEEIAVSIMAEIIRIKRDQSG